MEKDDDIRIFLFFFILRATRPARDLSLFLAYLLSRSFDVLSEDVIWVMSRR